MSKMANSVDRSDDWDARQQLEAGDEDFKPLTHDEAQRLLKANPPMSPWGVLVGQLVVGVLVACAAFALTGKQSAGWSAFYGALAVVIPAALFVRGLSRQHASADAGAALLGFFVWELVKIALTVAMLFAAPRLILQLSWLALLAGFVVTMKVYWVAMWLRLGRKSSVEKK
jgi:ATP synthase protein I